MEKGLFGFILTLALACALFFALPAESRLVEENKPSGRRVWCIANPFAPSSHVEIVVADLCRTLDCRSIQPGGDCYMPINLYKQASVVYNLYFRSKNSEPSACDLSQTAVIARDDPSFGNCKFS